MHGGIRRFGSIHEAEMTINMSQGIGWSTVWAVVHLLYSAVPMTQVWRAKSYMPTQHSLSLSQTMDESRGLQLSCKRSLLHYIFFWQPVDVRNSTNLGQLLILIHEPFFKKLLRHILKNIPKPWPSHNWEIAEQVFHHQHLIHQNAIRCMICW